MSTVQDKLAAMLLARNYTFTQIQEVDEQISAIVANRHATPDDGKPATWDEVAQYVMERIRNTVTCAFCRRLKQRDECVVLPLSGIVMCSACNDASTSSEREDEYALHSLEEASYALLRRQVRQME